MEVFIQFVLPYIVALLTAVISGFVSCFSAIKRCKLDNEIRIKEIQEQHKLDLDNQKEMFKLEIEKINLQHQNEIEKMKLESQNQLNNNVVNAFLSLLTNPTSINDYIALVENFDKNKQ